MCNLIENTKTKRNERDEKWATFKNSLYTVDKNVSWHFCYQFERDLKYNSLKGLK